MRVRAAGSLVAAAAIGLLLARRRGITVRHAVRPQELARIVA